MNVLRTLIAVALLWQVGACGSPDERARTYSAKGEQLLAQGELAKADLEFRNAIKYKQDYAPAWRGLFQIAEKRGNIQAAAVALKSIVDSDPLDMTARYKLAGLL